MEPSLGTLVSINVGGTRQFDYRDGVATSAIWKSPVSGRVAARGVNLEGDDQADRSVHGGPDKAIYAYAVEDLRWWAQALEKKLEYGQFGENLSTEGINVTGALVGERWQIGTALFEVSEPRVPCWKFAHRMGDAKFPKMFTQAGRPGAYLRIVTEGELEAGDEIPVVERPDHSLSIGDIFRIFTRDRSESSRLLEVPQLSDSWRQWAESLA
jgi:MOSC domain-containing protein YiiM